MRYPKAVTGLLEKAIKRVESLTAQEQDEIAAHILATIEDEQTWEDFYQHNAEHFRALAEEAINEHRRGETRPLDELLGE